jgi:RNA polymerase sigma-70 factor (ECF subfamily)
MAPEAGGGGGGDVGEFPAVAALHRPYLYRRALQLCRDHDRAEDLVQETLTRAWLGYQRFTQGTDVRAWMVTILKRVYFDARKHDGVIQRAQPQLVALGQASVEVASIPDAELQAALGSLQSDLRLMIEMFHFGGMKYREIADKLSLPLGTVSTQLMRARAALYEALNLVRDGGEP